MIEVRYSGDDLFERIQRAVDKVKDRLKRATEALNDAGVPYAVIGGNAVQFWVSQVDESVVRQTRDVDIILRRADFGQARQVLEKAGFLYRHAARIDMFLDGPDAKARDAVHVLFANERVREEDPMPVPDIDEFVLMHGARTLPLERLVRMKLTSFRDKDRVHLRDMLSIDMIDESWLPKMPDSLRERLQSLIDDPDG